MARILYILVFILLICMLFPIGYLMIMVVWECLGSLLDSLFDTHYFFMQSFS